MTTKAPCQGVWTDGTACEYRVRKESDWHRNRVYSGKFCGHHEGTGDGQMREYLPNTARAEKLNGCPKCGSPLRKDGYLLPGSLLINASIRGGQYYEDDQLGSVKFCPSCSQVVADLLMELGVTFRKAG